MSYNFASDTIEGAIERAYESTFRKLGGDPKESFLQCVQRVKDEPITPPNYGDLILERAKDDPQTRRYIEKLRRNGVRDEDIRSWYNMHMLERSCILYIHEVAIRARFFDLTLSGAVDPADATIALYKEVPRFGDPDSTDWGGAVRNRLTDEDRPLPIEMYEAVNDFVGRQVGERTFQVRLANATSLNAVIREEISRGTLYGAPSTGPTSGSTDHTKRCCICKRWLPLSEFSPENQAPRVAPGRLRHCKRCEEAEKTMSNTAGSQQTGQYVFKLLFWVIVIAGAAWILDTMGCPAP